MADIELVIKVPEKDWKFLKESNGCRWSKTIIEAVINGTLTDRERDRTLKALEQESKTDVIDKIKAEIQENINYNKKMNYQGIVAGLLLSLNIIDKYKT